MNPDDLWREFPSSLAAFQERFPDEAACREYLINLRWGGRPRCGRCDCDRTWELQNGRFECQLCGHQTSVTAGTLLHGTRKPLRLWFRAIWELAVRKSGINACELQRLMGFGSYETAWSWLHKLRRAMAARAATPLTGRVVADESYLGGKGSVAGRGTSKQTILVAAEDPSGRARLGVANDASANSIGPFVRRSIAPEATLVTDGWRGYSIDAVDGRKHDPHPIPDYRTKDPLIMCHLVTALLKRWWLGTYHGSMSVKHMPAYMEDFTFRFNRRKTAGIGRITARLLNLAVVSVPVTRAQLVAQPIPA
jgi:transposase-like protein